MHELSIANNLVEIVTEHVHDAGADRVAAIHLQIGALSCVHQEALEFSFELVTQGTVLEGARLCMESLPVIIYCSSCNQEIELPGIQSFRCPNCDTPSADIRQGKEMDLVSIEVADTPPATVS